MVMSGKDNLTFDAETHTYRINGERVPSVTQVLEGAGLIDTRWFNDEARTRGTYVALATQYCDEGTLDYDALDDGLRGYVEAWRKFKHEAGNGKMEIISIERRVSNRKLRYAGTLDRLFKWGHQSWVLDIKTGSKAAWHSLQTAGYAECLPKSWLHKRGSVFLKEDGTYKLDVHDDFSDVHVFLSALNLYHWKSEKGLLT